LFKQGEYKLIAPAKPIFSYFLSEQKSRQAGFLSRNSFRDEAKKMTPAQLFRLSDYWESSLSDRDENKKI